MGELSLSSRKTEVLGRVPVVPCDCGFCGPLNAKVVSCGEGGGGGSDGGGGGGSVGQLTSDVHQRILQLVSDLCFSYESVHILGIFSNRTPYCGVCGSSPDRLKIYKRDERDDGVAAEVQSDTADDDGVGALGEIYPLPYLWSSARKPGGRSARSRARYHWKLHFMELGRSMIDTLNEWYASLSSAAGACRSARRKRRRRGRTSGASTHYHQLLSRLRSRVHHASRAFCSGGEDDVVVDKNKEIPRDDEFYGVIRGRGGVETVPLTVANVAIPGSGRNKVNLVDLVPPPVAAQLESGAVRRAPPDDIAQPAAQRSGEVYKTMLHGVVEGQYEPLVELLTQKGLVELVRTPGEATQGIFGVPKGDLARLILNAVAANLQCLPPPDPKLPLIESLSKLVIPAGARLYWSLLDLSDYYHVLVLPPALRSLFGLPPVWVDGEQWYPRWVTLPMGWSWAVYLAQLAHTYQLSLRSSRYRDAVSLEGPPIPRFLDPGVDGVGTYIDDQLALSLEAERSVSLIKELVEVEITPVKESKIQLAAPGKAVQGWGIELGATGVFQPPPLKLSALVHRTYAVIKAVYLPTKALLSLIGKWLWFALLVRPTLSVFTPLFRQGRSRHFMVRLWPSSVKALRQLISISPLLCVDPARPVGWLVATDSSSRGGGAVFCSNYGGAGLRQAAPLCYYKGRDDLGTAEYRDAVGHLVRSFRFQTGFGWRWRRLGEHITLKEGRALWVGIQRVVFHSKSPCNARHTFLQDNMGVIGAFSKGRSKQPVLNALIQRTAAVQLTTGGSADWLWCPTAHQPADAPSRGLRRT